MIQNPAMTSATAVACHAKWTHSLLRRSLPSKFRNPMEVKTPSVIKPRNPIAISEGCHANNVPASTKYRFQVVAATIGKFAKARFSKTSRSGASPSRSESGMLRTRRIAKTCTTFGNTSVITAGSSGR